MEIRSKFCLGSVAHYMAVIAVTVIISIICGTLVSILKDSEKHEAVIPVKTLSNDQFMCDPTNKTYLWRIGNKTSVQGYLFGTIHLSAQLTLYQDDTFDQVMKAINESEEFYFEMDISDKGVIKETSNECDLNKHNVQLKDLIYPKLYKRLQSLIDLMIECGASKETLSNIEKLRPDYAVRILRLTYLQTPPSLLQLLLQFSDKTPARSKRSIPHVEDMLDLFLIKTLKDKGYKIVALETPKLFCRDKVVSKRIRSYRIWKTINEIEKDILNGLNKELFQNAREDLQKLFIGYICKTMDVRDTII